jgi:hypothetical protein
MDARIIAAMGEFAATTKNDAMSVHVARIVQKLQNAGRQFEAHYTRITAADRRVIAMFERDAAQYSCQQPAAQAYSLHSVNS